MDQIDHQSIPEIQVNDISEEKKSKKNRSLELYEEIDEIGSFMEDNKSNPEIIVKTSKVRNDPFRNNQ